MTQDFTFPARNISYLKTLQDIFSDLRETNDPQEIDRLAYLYQSEMSHLVVSGAEDGIEFGRRTEKACEMKKEILPLFKELSFTAFPRAESLRALKNITDTLDPQPNAANKFFPG